MPVRASVERICRAHRPSRLRPTSGWQTKIAPPAGVSPGPVDVVRARDVDAREMRHRRVAVLHADEDVVGASTRGRRTRSSFAACALLQECHADRLRARLTPARAVANLEAALSAGVIWHAAPRVRASAGPARCRRLRARRAFAAMKNIGTSSSSKQLHRARR